MEIRIEQAGMDVIAAVSTMKIRHSMGFPGAYDTRDGNPTEYSVISIGENCGPYNANTDYSLETLRSKAVERIKDELKNCIAFAIQKGATEIVWRRLPYVRMCINDAGDVIVIGSMRCHSVPELALKDSVWIRPEGEPTSMLAA